MKKKRNYTKCLAKRNKHPTQSLNEFFCGIIPKLSFLQETQKLEIQKLDFGLNGDPDRIRTCNLPLRRGLLYPVEPRDLRIDLDLILGFVI